MRQCKCHARWLSLLIRLNSSHVAFDQKVMTGSQGPVNCFQYQWTHWLFVDNVRFDKNHFCSVTFGEKGPLVFKVCFSVFQSPNRDWWCPWGRRRTRRNRNWSCVARRRQDADTSHPRINSRLILCLWFLFPRCPDRFLSNLFFKSFRLKVSSRVRSISSFYKCLSYTCVTCHLIFWQSRLFLKLAFQEEPLVELERKLQKCQVMNSDLNLLQQKCLHYTATCLVLDQILHFLPRTSCETKKSINMSQLRSIFTTSNYFNY